MDYDRDRLIARLAAAVVAVQRARSLAMGTPEHIRAWRIASLALGDALDWLAEYARPGEPVAQDELYARFVRVHDSGDFYV